MLRINECKQLNIHSSLFDRIPENHILKKIDAAVSFDFVNDLLADSYCKDFGRPAKEPSMMIKIELIRKLFNYSDERVIAEAQVNLAYMWFIGINPSDELPHPSLLSKFRTMRLKDVNLDDILTEVIRQCIKKEIIDKDDEELIDTTHILANTIKKVPERIMKHLAKRIFKAMEKTDYEIPDYTQIKEHNEAKIVMKEYLEEVIKEAGKFENKEVKEEIKNDVRKEIEKARNIIDSPLFIEQRGIRSIIDTDARVGYKTKTDNFFGYKAEYTMMAKSGLITAVETYHGAYADGEGFAKLHERSKQAGLNILAAHGDKAYFKRDILDILKEDGIKAYIPVSESAYRINEELFSYNKDSDEWVCVRGNRSVSKRIVKTNRKDRGETTQYEYKFNGNECVNCPLRDECIKKSKTKVKRLMVGLSTAEYYEHNQWTKTEEFKEGYKKRSAIERKNAEQKRFHGLARAEGFGLRSVSKQAKITAIAVNLKAIAKLMGIKEHTIFNLFAKFLKLCNTSIILTVPSRYIGLEIA